MGLKSDFLSSSGLQDFVINDEMRYRAIQDIAKRSITGCYIYLLIWFALIIPNKLYISNPAISTWVTVYFILLSGARVLLIYNYKTVVEYSLFAWKILYYPLVLLPSLGWGILCALSFTHPIFEPFSLIIIISTAGLAGGGVSALVPNRMLTIGLISTFLFPAMLAIMVFKDDYNISVPLIFGIYWVGLYSVTRIQYKEYWQGLKYYFLLKEHALELEHLSNIDGLTSLKNRRYFNDSLRKEIKVASRSQHNLSLLLIDIDHFKDINDLYGHLAGDECLRALSKLLVQQLKRETDIIVRYGGEEFAVVLPNIDGDTAESIANGIRKSVEKNRINHGDLLLSFTVSIGVTSIIPPKNYTLETFIESADSALYRAKNGGRNQVCVT